MKKMIGIMIAFIVVYILSGCSVEISYPLNEIDNNHEIEVIYLKGNDELIASVKMLTELCEEKDIELTEWKYDYVEHLTLEEWGELKGNSEDYIYIDSPIIVSDDELLKRIRVLNTLLTSNQILQCEVCLDTLIEIPYLTGDELLISRIETLLLLIEENDIPVPTWAGTNISINEKGEDTISTYEVDEYGCLTCTDTVNWVAIPISDDELLSTTSEMEELLIANGITIPD